MSRHETKLLPLLTWRGAIGDSELPPVARHVALALSLYMSEKGDSAYPGAARIAHDTGWSVRSVRTGLTTLVSDGWLTLVERGGVRGERRHANVYQARIPARPLPFVPEPSTTRAVSAPVQEVHPCSTDTRAGDSTDPCTSRPSPVQEVHPISSSNSPLNSPITPPTPPAVKAKKRDVPEPTPEFNEFWAAYPKRAGKIPALKAWQKAIGLAPTDDIIAGAARYARSCENNRTESAYIKHPGPWLNDCRWTDEPDQDSTLTMLARLVAESRVSENVIDVTPRLELGR